MKATQESPPTANSLASQAASDRRVTPSEGSPHWPASEETFRLLLTEQALAHATRTVGLALLDTHLRVLHANDRFAEMTAVPSSEHGGRTIRELMPGAADGIEAIALRVPETAKPVLDADWPDSTPADPSHEHALVMNVNPLLDGGKAWGLSLVVQERPKHKKVCTTFQQNAVAPASRHDGFRERALGEGAMAFVSKPLDIPWLLRQLREMTG